MIDQIRFEHHVKVVTAFAEYYSKAVSPNLLEMYVDDLMCLSEGELQIAAKLYRGDPHNRFFPIPAALIALVKPQQSANDAANEAASNIIKCLSEDGYTNPDRARMKMGDLAWNVVKRMGGWTRLCEELQNRDIPSYRAQFRELAAVLHRKFEAGLPDTPPSLPENKTVAIKAMNAVMEKATPKQIPRGDSE